MEWLVVDIICVIIIVISVLANLKRNVVFGIYDLVASIVVLLIVLHFYPVATDWVKTKFSVLPEGFGDFLAVGFSLFSAFVLAKILKELITFFVIAIEPGFMERIINLLLEFCAGAVTASLFCFWVYLSPWETTVKAVESGRISSVIYSLPAQIYTFTIDYLIKPYVNKSFEPNELVYFSEGKEGGK